MDAIQLKQPEICFGSDPFNPHRTRPTEIVGGATVAELRHELVRTCPRVPGVYGMRDPHGQLIYVGKSKSLRSRLLSYFADSNAAEKGGRILEQTRTIQWETQPSDFAASIREQHLIRLFTPRWNVQGVPQRQRPVYLCLGRAPAPTFYLNNVRPANCVSVEGPFHGAGRMGQAVDALNKLFRLRDCSQKQVIRFAEQLQLFDLDYRPGCLRLEIGTCSGPCVAACTRHEYDTQVQAATAFLDGTTSAVIEDVREQMQTAAASRQYELASGALATLRTLEYVARRLAMFAKARQEYSFIYAASGYDSCAIWYLIIGGEITDVAAAPRCADEYAAIKPTLRRWSAILKHSDSRRHGDNAHTVALTASWFRKQRQELTRTFLPEQAAHRYYRKSLAALASGAACTA